MRHLLTLLIMLLITALDTTSMASRRMQSEVNTGTPLLDTIILRCQQNLEWLSEEGVGRLSLEAYVCGHSQCEKSSRLAHLFSNMLPFEINPNRETSVEALCQIDYHYPSKLQFSPVAMRSNTRRGRYVLREVYQVLLPIYAITRANDKGSDKSYVFPFSSDGLNLYNFRLIDATFADKHKSIIVDFWPKKKHHTLLSGHIMIDPVTLDPISISFASNIDFARAETDITFRFDSTFQCLLPAASDIVIHYDYRGVVSTNSYSCRFRYKDFISLDSLKVLPRKLDLTDIYQISPLQKIDFDTLRPVALPPHIDSLLSQPQINTASRRSKTLIQSLPGYLVGSTNVNPFGTTMKIYGPLDPAAFGYDKRNGITLRERIRWSHLYGNSQSLIGKIELGYSFGRKEPRYKFDLEWMHHPERRSGLRLRANNRSSGFSSKFKHTIDNALDNIDNRLDFDDLGIDYFHHYQWNIEHSWELANGLMLYAGSTYNYRTPVKRGYHKMTDEQINSLIKSHYADLGPYLRLSWTPHQYYRFVGHQKLYVGSPYPTFTLEMTRGIPHILSTQSNFGRIEFNANQSIRLGDFRNLSYNFGFGGFFRQRVEYFINYNYFSRSQYPASWDENIGGVFHLLDDYWYSSSPRYVQSHLMYETPFLLLHLARPISKYVIKERIYLSNLWADGKNAYTEIGYGMGNNYFNVGVFGGWIGLEHQEFGIKATIEIDSHW